MGNIGKGKKTIERRGRNLDLILEEGRKRRGRLSHTPHIDG